MNDWVSDSYKSAETDKIDEDLTRRVDQFSFLKLFGSLLIGNFL